jgi:hypothetical protein
VTVASNAAANLVSTAKVSGGADASQPNNTSTDTVAVSGFTLADSPATNIVKAGQVTSFSILVSPQGTPLNSTVTLSVLGLPANTMASIQPASFTLGATAQNAVLTINTAPGDGFIASRSLSHLNIFAIWVPMFGIVLLLPGVAGGDRHRKKLARLIAFPLALLLLLLPGCGAASSGFKTIGSPTGKYVLTVTASSGAIQQTQTVTLFVQ